VAVGPGHEYDVFVSYAHADNEKPLGSSAKFGWVTTLAHNLNTGPNVYRKKLFIDHQLRPGDAFSDALLTKVANSTALVLLLSQNYVDSDWCGKEFDHFVRTHGSAPDKPADVFVVELSPFESFTDVPLSIQSLRKQLIHAKFWHKAPDAASPLLAGYPTPQESEPESARHYWRVLHELRDAIDSRLRALRRVATQDTDPAPAADPAPASPPRAAKPTLGTVLLADTTDDLVAQRNAVKSALEPEGIMVLPQGDYVGLTPEEFDAAFADDLGRSQLFVQLLSVTPGRTGRGFAAPLPQLQFDRAVSAKQPIMQWCERSPGPDEIADPAHAKLFRTRFLRVTSRTGFESEIVARLREMQRAIEAERAAASAAPAPTADKKLVFVDDIAGEPALNERLRAILHSTNFSIRSLPAKAPLGNNGIDIAQVLKPCRAGITVFADSAKLATVYNRLIFFLNQIAESGLPVARWGVCVTPGTAGCDLGLASDDLVAVDEQGLADFLRGL
jgi:TIR domain